MIRGLAFALFLALARMGAVVDGAPRKGPLQNRPKGQSGGGAGGGGGGAATIGKLKQKECAKLAPVALPGRAT